MKTRFAWLIAGLLALCAASGAHASTMRFVPITEAVQKAQKVVQGTVTSIDVKVDSSGAVWTRYTLTNAKTAKGKLKTNKTFHFRCRGGASTEGSEFIPGTPRLALGEEVIVAYAPQNKWCEVLGWLQGTLKIKTSPSGKRLVLDHEGRPVKKIDQTGLTVGQRPSWVERKHEGVLNIVHGQAHKATSDDEASLPTDSEVMASLQSLATSLPNLGPKDTASEGTLETIGPRLDLEPAVAPQADDGAQLFTPLHPIDAGAP